MQDIIIKKNEEKIIPILWLGQESVLSRNIYLAEDGAKVTLLALLLGRNKDNLEIKTQIFHQKPNTTSKVIVKAALTDNSFVNFDGLVKIEPGAKGTNAHLAAHIMLLSNKARGRAVPSLEILENDIKAGHATTVGRVNELEMFYLMSRGLTANKARMLIVEGFLNSIIMDLPLKLSNQAKEELKHFIIHEKH